MNSKKSAKPLSGIRIIIGRAKAQAGSLAKLLREQGATVTAIPFIEIREPKSFKPLDTALREILEYDWLILTSVNGVEAMFERMKKLRLEVGWIAHLRIAAIGPATKEAIEKHGLDVHVVPGEYVAESVVKALKKKVEGRRVLLVRAKVARDVIPDELRKAGAAVDVVEAYETVLPKASRDATAGGVQGQSQASGRDHVHEFFDRSNFVELDWREGGLFRRVGWRETRFHRSGNHCHVERAGTQGEYQGEGIHDSRVGESDCRRARVSTQRSLTFAKLNVRGYAPPE